MGCTSSVTAQLASHPAYARVGFKFGSPRATDGLVCVRPGRETGPTMTFVYRGAGKRQSKSADPCQKDKTCQKLSCDIQWCLSRSNYQQHRCKEFVDRWNKCCDRVRRKAQAKSPDHTHTHTHTHPTKADATTRG